MKIVYCIPQLYRPGGIERIVTLKTNYLTEVYGYDVTIVTADQKEMNPFYELNKKVKMTSNPQLSSSASFLRLNVLSSLN